MNKSQDHMVYANKKAKRWGVAKVAPIVGPPGRKGASERWNMGGHLFDVYRLQNVLVAD